MIHDHQHHHHQEIITEIEPDMPTVELDMIIEEIDEDHTGRVTFERNYTDDDDDDDISLGGVSVCGWVTLTNVII